MHKAAITIDVDSLRFYREIHGLGGNRNQEVAADPIYTRAMPRFWELISELRAPATLFLIGADAPLHADRFSPARELGSEIASHSFAHDYRLTQRDARAIAADLEAAHEALIPLSPDGEIRGFRAPGYNTSRALLRAVVDRGYLYDSSLLPSPLYFALRGLAIGAYALLRRPSRSLIGDPRAFIGTMSAHRVELTRSSRLLEIPIACEPWSRAPLFGTSWVMAGERIRSLMLKSALASLELINFEMHAIDLLDASDLPPGDPLAAAQRDLKVPVAEKMRAFRGLFRALAGSRELMTLRGLAETIISDT